MAMLQQILISDFILENGLKLSNFELSYEVFGQQIGTAPIILVNHALTGNSSVAGDNGWWTSLIGINKTINTEVFTVLAFNIPGNGYDQEHRNLISNYKDYTAADIAQIFWTGLFQLHIDNLFAVIGGSLGGGIAWEMAKLEPSKIENLIPIGTDWKATDWLIANVLVQDNILNNSTNPIEDARAHAMLIYRTPQSFKEKFRRNLVPNSDEFAIEKWLKNHGIKLRERFGLQSYKLMNHLLKTINFAKTDTEFVWIAKNITANIHIVSIDSDAFFIAKENQLSFEYLSALKNNVWYHEMKSIHGHDAFLIEFEQLNKFLKPIFANVKKCVEPTYN